LQSHPKEQQYTELCSKVILVCQGELEVELERSLGITKEYISVLSWPVLYESHIVVRVSPNKLTREKVTQMDWQQKICVYEVNRGEKSSSEA
jgi:hypothetical protein